MSYTLLGKHWSIEDMTVGGTTKLILRENYFSLSISPFLKIRIQSFNISPSSTIIYG